MLSCIYGELWGCVNLGLAGIFLLLEKSLDTNISNEEALKMMTC